MIFGSGQSTGGRIYPQPNSGARAGHSDRRSTGWCFALRRGPQVGANYAHGDPQGPSSSLPVSAGRAGTEPLMVLTI